MRTITIDELPENFHHQAVIKSGERTRHQKMAVALERTLKHCSEIHAEYESQTVRLRENCEREGFITGFQLFFSQLVNLIEEHQRLQQQRQNEFRQHIIDALSTSLHDPMIVERIIHHLQERCGHQKALRIIIPAAVRLPDNVEVSSFQYTEDNHITVQNDMDAIRFPSESLCREWLQHAEEEIAAADTAIANLTPDLLRNIAGQLIAMSHQHPKANSEPDKGEHNE